MAAGDARRGERRRYRRLLRADRQPGASAMTSIAFIGVGNMGGPMARNLLKAGEGVTAFDVSPAALKPVTEAGGKAASTALEAVTSADVVITMLPAGRHVRDVYLDEDSILTAARPDALLIDCSTIDVDAARAV